MTVVHPLKSAERMIRELDPRLPYTDRRVVDMLNDAAHEIRSPIARLKGYADLLACGALPAEDLPGLGRRMQDQASRLAATVDDILELARIDACGGLNSQLRLASPRAIVEDALNGLDPGELDRIALVAPALPLPPLLVDDRRIVRALLNILENACKYSPAGRPIRISIAVRRRASRTSAIAIHVRDQGVGISASDASHAFERFFRSESVKDQPGSGLGLAIAERIIHLHRGQIRLRGRLGLGTIVSILIPCAQPSPS